MSFEQALAVALETALVAGALLRDDFHRPGGARGHGDKAEADHEAETLVRARLLQAFPDWGYLGEETGAAAGRAGKPVWVVDPNDGTRDYLKGRRGSSVSIGAVYAGRPVLGVVYAYSYPDDDGDLFAWAEGCGRPRRNGRECLASLPTRLAADDIVLVSSKGDRHPTAQLRWAAPARFRAVPSIAHRLALLAAGDAALVTSLYGPKAWDLAAGHALVRGAGGVLVDDHGAEVRYAADGRSQAAQAYAGSPEAVRSARERSWQRLDSGPHEDVTRVTLRRGQAVRDASLLSRAQGALLGQMAGDSLGGLVEFQSAAAIAARSGGAPRLLADGGCREALAGQPGGDGEQALALARALVARGEFDVEGVGSAYREWLGSGPASATVGPGDLVEALGEREPRARQPAGHALMRASPLGLVSHARSIASAVELTRVDAALSHQHLLGDALAACVIAVAHAVGSGAGAESTYAAALGWAGTHAHVDVLAALQRARQTAPVCDDAQPGDVLIALQNAFHVLLHAPSLEEGVVATVARGGDSGRHAALAGMLLGAVHGREAVPASWRRLVLSCRTHPARARRPRPATYWPTDALELAERLLLVGSVGGE